MGAIYSNDIGTIKVLERSKKLQVFSAILDHKVKCVHPDCRNDATLNVYDLTVCPRHANMIMNRISNVYVNFEEL